MSEKWPDESLARIDGHRADEATLIQIDGEGGYMIENLQFVCYRVAAIMKRLHKYDATPAQVRNLDVNAADLREINVTTDELHMLADGMVRDGKKRRRPFTTRNWGVSSRIADDMCRDMFDKRGSAI